MDNRKLERNLPLLGEVECPIPMTSDTKGHWEVKVETSKQEDAGTSAKVLLSVYGEKGQKSLHPLEREAFMPGSEETFEVCVVSFGLFSKILLYSNHYFVMEKMIFVKNNNLDKFNTKWEPFVLLCTN